MGDDANDPEPVELAPLIGAGLLQVAHPTPAELDAFIDLTLELDDGEAMTAAIAIYRGWAIATDDRAALRLLAGRVTTISTLELIKQWTDSQSIAPRGLRDVLLAVRERASYLPGRHHALRAWWDTVMDAP